MGMVGALSIVRFRTAVKDPLDTAYMFWALTMGILLGAGLYLPALIVVLCISVLLFVLSFVKMNATNAYLLVLHYDEYSEGAINAELRRSVKFSKLRSKTLTRGGAEGIQCVMPCIKCMQQSRCFIIRYRSPHRSRSRGLGRHVKKFHLLRSLCPSHIAEQLARRSAERSTITYECMATAGTYLRDGTGYSENSITILSSRHAGGVQGATAARSFNHQGGATPCSHNAIALGECSAAGAHEHGKLAH
jgi:hypothetical protein